MMRKMPGMLIDYHLIFMLLTLMLFFGSIFLIWLVNTKHSCIVASLLLSANLMFCMITIMGFLGIDYFGFDSTTGLTTVNVYQDMYMFAIVFEAILWLNGGMLFISIYKYTRIVLNEKMKEVADKTW
jgi:hypothetical protein